MKVERLAYALWGNNVIIGSHIRRQLRFLEEVVPEELKGRRMDDLGCGDGKVTLLLERVFSPVRMRAYDINPGLVKRAAGRGIEAAVMDLERNVPRGELAVLWGVLHHLDDFRGCLRRVVENYPLVFIREPVRTGWDPLELGKPLRMKALAAIFGNYLPGCGIHYYEHSIMVIYADKQYLAGEMEEHDRESCRTVSG